MLNTIQGHDLGVDTVRRDGLSKGPPPAGFLAILGGAILAFQLYSLGKWITGPYFVSTPHGPDTISAGLRLSLIAWQVAVPILAVAMLWQILFKPWLKKGKMTTDGRLIAAFAMIFFWDNGMNFSSTALLYNSYLINRGSWTLGSWPGWLSPDGNALPEPIFVTIPGYVSLVFSQVMLVCWLLRKAKARWTGMGPISSLAFIIVGLFIIDTAIEVFLLQTDVYAYPSSLRWLSLFAGQRYQFPITEGVTFALGMTGTALLSFYRGDNGKTWAEAGIERINFFGNRGREVVRFLAVFGFIHGTFFMGYTLPNQYLSLTGDPWPAHLPSYLINGMCVYGPHANQCPGPGVLTPRGPFKIVPGGVGLSGA